MLGILRHKGFSRKVLWAVAGIIILSFGVFGTAYRLDTTINSAGKIYGKSVSLRDFERAYRDSRDQAIMSYGDRFFTMGQMLDLERDAWTRLIIGKETKKRNIKVTDEEVVVQIASIPFFQTEGRFDKNKYEMIVRNPRYFDRKPKDFEEGVRGTIAMKKLFNQVVGPLAITDADLKQEYIKRHEKIKLSYVLFSPSDFSKGLSITDDEARQYYASNKESFRQPPMVNVQYVHLMYPDKADDKQKQVVKDQAIAIAHELNPKADFAAIATKHNQPAKESGFFTQEQPLLTFAWSPEFVDKIFAMKQGEISSPQETPDGWQIVKIKEKKDTLVPPFEEIVSQVKEAAIAKKAFDAATAKADTMLQALSDQVKTKEFKAAAQGLGLKAEETTPFSRGEYINAPGLIAEFQEESMRLNESRKLSGVVATSQGPVILYLSSTEPVDDKKFAEDKEDFRQMMLAQRSNETIAKFVTKLKLEANLQADLKNKIRYRPS
jgi:peptidyl-prolyl cis-trans isomerase D